MPLNPFTEIVVDHPLTLCPFGNGWCEDNDRTLNTRWAAHCRQTPPNDRHPKVLFCQRLIPKQESATGDISWMCVDYEELK
jgi:hypothetical protein